MMIVTLSASLFFGATTSIEPFLTFSRRASGIGFTQIEIGTLPSTNGRRYWLRRAEDGPDGVQVSWADTQSCDAASGVISGAAAVDPPGIHVPGIPVTEDGSITLTLDGAQYSFSSQAHYAGNISSRISFTSNVGTPLAHYVETSIEALEQCWSDQRPDAFYPSSDNPSPE